MFKILNYLEKMEIVRETPTHLTCVCPVCGDDNLKIKKTSPYKHAYKCWSNYCSNEDIKKALGVRNLIPSTTKRVLPRIKPPQVTFNGKDIVVINNYQPLPKKIKKFGGGYTVEEIIYPYSQTQRVLRIDNITTKTKYIYIQYLDEDFTWLSGAGSSFWFVYDYGIGEALANTQFDTVLFVEGEKTAEFCKERGLAAITVMSGNFHDSLNKTVMLFKATYPHIRNVIYVPDADEPGLKKAQHVQECCWFNNIGCKIIGMSSVVAEPFEGMDLADLDENTFRKFTDGITRKQCQFTFA